ncbi:uncharacterized protein NECHADRAFT_51300 [Fusarium vanettenii 77-13-4]|uniref:Major facilitator superfamily (MFS) profile domain-containing protein n=1 Tax=Fusarium vanettenii (strain ATCC MYA-4622 / CBS 123669 / FGSC 9596 / NRRL 45880 / 77-13-4) TaxID=660122 RepID=C7ZF02_FUSV7|nr:uncharacterized protein NECHADRAFT_51300 [Fusarium vanettenii 77-13-4]EEU37488.1 hypothetical protein NECHADRAFT_51300 [Fusarium vanettenii 77-13-4]
MASSKEASDEAPSVNDTSTSTVIPDGGLLAWLQVAGSFCLYFCTWASFGSFQTIYENDELSSRTPFQISVIGSLQTFLMVFSGFVMGPIYDAGYFRHLLAVGSFFIVVGTVLQSLCNRYWQYILTQGLMIGIGAGCLSILSVAITSLWFTTKLPLANGVAACGSGLGGVLLPIMVREIHARTTLPWAVRAVALLLLVMLSFANLVLRPRGAAKEPPGCFSVFLGMYTPFVYIQPYALGLDIVSPKLALYLLAILNSSSIFGRIFPALLAQRIGPMNMIIATAVALGITSLCLMSATSLPRLLVTVLVHGFFTGSFFALQPTIFVRLASDPRMIGTRFGMAFSVMSFALLFGPPVAGALRKAKGYNGAWIWAGLTILVGGGLILTSRLFKGRGTLRI